MLLLSAVAVAVGGAIVIVGVVSRGLIPHSGSQILIRTDRLLSLIAKNGIWPWEKKESRKCLGEWGDINYRTKNWSHRSRLGGSPVGKPAFESSIENCYLCVRAVRAVRPSASPHCSPGLLSVLPHRPRRGASSFVISAT